MTRRGLRPRKAIVFGSFLKRTIQVFHSVTLGLGLLGASPQTPWVRFAEVGVKELYSSTRLKPRRATVFGSFFKKNNTILPFSYSGFGFAGG
jgi:hypothetical protein